MPELSGPLFDISQSVRRDGLEMFLVYNSINGPFTNGDLWVSTRETTSQPWSKPVSLGPAINTDADDSFPSLSCEGTELFFASTRPGGAGGEDLYVATRKSLEALVSEPLLLSTSADGKGQGAILHAGTSQVVSSANPAIAGEILEIYCQGLIDGGVVAPQVYIGGRLAQLRYWGGNQMNAVVPAGIASGPAIPIRFTYLDRLSNEVTIGLR